MSFLSPLFLIGAVTAAVPIALHLFHREPEVRVRFAAVKLLRHAPVEDARRRRLREWLLLALRVAALVLIALAFARPFFASGAAESAGHVTVIALDTSLSLSAPGQFARAKTLAGEAIARAPSGDLVGVVTFADAAHVAAAPSTDRALARAAVEAASPGFGATDYGAALGLASQTIEAAGGRDSTIVVVTDLQASGWDAAGHVAVPASARVEIADVGVPPPNLAITGVRLVGDRVVATVRNDGPRERDARARLTVDGRDVGQGVATVAPRQTAEIELAGARGEAASVSVDDESGVQGDNVRYLVLGNSGLPSVVVVTANGDLSRDAFYLQQALAATSGAEAIYQVDGTSGARVASEDAARLQSRAAVALLSTRGLDARGRAVLAEYVRRGGGLLVAAASEVDGDAVAEILGGAAAFAPSSTPSAAAAPRFMSPADVRHPVFQAFGSRAGTLGLVTFREIVPIAGKTCQTVAQFTTGEPALIDCGVGEGRALLFASDLDNRGNDFPLHGSFVPFVHEAVRYLAGGRRLGGEYLVGDVPPGVRPVPGISSAPGRGGPSGATSIAVNVDPREADSERLSEAEFQAGVDRLKEAGRAEGWLKASQQEARQHVWQYLLLLAAAVLAAESFVSTRAA